MSQTYIGIPQPQYDFWRQSGSSSGSLPNGTNDTTKQIQHLGNVSLGGNFTNVINGVVTPAAPNVYLFLSSSPTLGRGQILFSDSPLSYYFTRALPTVVNNYVDLMSLALTNVTHNFRLSVTTNDSATSPARSYLVTTNSNMTSGAWRTLIPVSDSGASATHDYDMLIMVDATTLRLRARRKSGTGTCTLRMRIESVGREFVTATELSTSGTDATVYDAFQTFSAARDFFRSGTGTTEPDGVNDTTEAIARTGGIMIGASNPTNIAAALDVTGATVNRVVSVTNIAASGAIGTAAATVDVASYINLNQTTVNVNVTLPTPTNSTAGRLLIIANTGTALFTVNSNVYIAPQTSREFVWNGSSWYPLTNNPSAIITDWSFKSSTGISASTFSWKGNRFTPDRDVLLYSMCYFGTIVANGTYQAAVVTGTGSPGNVATATKSVSYTVGASPANLLGAFIWLDFTFPVLLTAGTIYGLMVGRTDAGDSYVLPTYMNGGNTINTAVPMVGLSHGNAWRIASAALTIGTAIDAPALDSHACGYRFKYPTSPF